MLCRGGRPVPTRSCRCLAAALGCSWPTRCSTFPGCNPRSMCAPVPHNGWRRRVATFGLLLVVLGHRRPEDAPWMVAAWIGAAYWFTASTSFANPAITIARSLSDTFAGIRPADAPAFIAATADRRTAGLLVARCSSGADRCDDRRAQLETLRARDRAVSSRTGRGP